MKNLLIKNLDIRDLPQLGSVLTLAAVARLYNLGQPSLWIDEVATIQVASYPLSKLWVTAYDPTPPLYYTLIHFGLNLGHTEFLLRLPSALFGVLTVAVVYVATRRIGGSLAALAGSVLVALSFHNLEYSQEARAYSLLGFCLSVSFLGLVNLSLRWREDCSGFTISNMVASGGGLYAAGLLAALYTHNTAVFYWLGVQPFFLIWWFRPLSFSRAALVSWLALNFIALLLWLPWLSASLDIMDSGSFSWLHQLDFKSAYSTWRRVHGMPASLPGQPWIDAALLVFALMGIYGLRKRPALCVLLVGLLLFSSAAIWAFGYVAAPIFMLRTILWGSLFSAVLIGLGVSYLPPRIGYAVVLVLTIAGANGAYQFHNTNRAENENWRSAAEFIAKRSKHQDILLFRTHYITPPFFYYFDGISFPREILGWNCIQEQALEGNIRYDGPLPRVAWSASDLGPNKPIGKRAGSRLWIIEAHCLARSWDKADNLFYPNWGLVKTHKFSGVYIHEMSSGHWPGF